VVSLVLVTPRSTSALIALAVVVIVWTGPGPGAVRERCLSRLLHRPRGGAVRSKLPQLGLAGGLVAVIAAMVVVVTETTQLRHSLGLDGWMATAIGLTALVDRR
jgi:hypothetical protein